MRIIEESIDISYSLLPKSIKSREKNMVFHFAYIFKKNKLISIGQNNPEKTHPTAKKFSDRFKTGLEYPYLHAEIDAISKVWNQYKIDESMSLIVFRFNKYGVLRYSKPCKTCSKIISALSFGEVWWSTNGKCLSNIKNEYKISR